MRVTERRMMSLVSNGSATARAQVAEASRKLSSGVAVERPSHDPVRWAQGMRQKTKLTMAGDYRGTVDRARAKLDAADNGLGRIAGALTRAREIATAMATATVDGPTRAAAEVEVQGLFADMLAGANAEGPDGEYVLAGHAGDVAPFDATGTYVGDNGLRFVETSEGRQHAASLPGTVLTVAEGIDVFGTVSALQAALTANDPAAVQTAMVDITTAIEQVSMARGRAGAASAALSSTGEALEQFEVQLTQSIEAAVITDPIVAATELAHFSNQLETSRVVAERIAMLMDPNR